MNTRVRRYTSMPLAILVGVTFACATTSPADGASVTEGTPVNITGTIASGAVTVLVKLGATVLGYASIVGLSWSFTWTPQSGDVGSRTINATATAANGQQANAVGVDVTVASSAFNGAFNTLAASYSLNTRCFRRGDLGVAGTTGTGKTTWANQSGDFSAMTAGSGTTNGFGSVGAGLAGKASVTTDANTQYGTYTAPSATAPATTQHMIYAIQRILATPPSVGYMHDAAPCVVNMLGGQTSPAANANIFCGSPGATTTGVVINQWYAMIFLFKGGSDIIKIGAHAPTPTGGSNNAPGLTWTFGAAGNGSVKCQLETVLKMHLEGTTANLLAFAADAGTKAQSFWNNSIEI